MTVSETNYDKIMQKDRLAFDKTTLEVIKDNQLYIIDIIKVGISLPIDDQMYAEEIEKFKQINGIKKLTRKTSYEKTQKTFCLQRSQIKQRGYRY